MPGDCVHRLRIIPAYAGCTFAMAGTKYRPPDHPRLRGVHYYSAPVIVTFEGSSPLTRGALPGLL